MKPEHRFHSYVTTATVMAMYFVIQHVMPLLRLNPTLEPYLKPIGTLLLSLGVYNFFATLLRAVAKRFKFVKRHLLGPHYLNGTWIGKFQAIDASTVFTVEHFEQTLSSLKIRGQAFSEDGQSYAYWNSVSETIDVESGILTYTYKCDKTDNKVSFQGVCVFQLERADEESPAERMRGYSADLVDGRRIENREKKVSEDLLSFDEGLRLAK
jgi:hypothetical protein